MKPKDLLLLYAQEYQSRFGRSYPISWKKETAQAKRLLGLYSADDLRRMVELYVHSYSDRFHEVRGKPFSLFVLAVPALVALMAQAEQNKPQASTDAERLRKAREEYEQGSSSRAEGRLEGDLD